MGVSRQQLHKILAGERAVTAEMAARLGKYCGNGPELWLNLQSAYDLWHAQNSLADELEDIPDPSCKLALAERVLSKNSNALNSSISGGLERNVDWARPSLGS